LREFSVGHSLARHAALESGETYLVGSLARLSLWGDRLLRDTAAPDAELKRGFEMIARAYAPCISCSVQVVRVGRQHRGPTVVQTELGLSSAVEEAENRLVDELVAAASA